MRQLLTLALSLGMVASAAGQGQGEIIIRKPGVPDRVIRLDSATAREELAKVQGQLHELMVTKLEPRMKELQGKLQRDVEASRTRTLAIRQDGERASTDRMFTEQALLPTMMKQRLELTQRRQPHLGVQVSVEPRETDKYGAYITAVTPGSPAEKAGILSGDVITKLGGKSLAAADSKEESNPGLRLISVIGTLTVGKPADVQLRRGTQNLSLKVTPIEDGMSGSIARMAPSIAEISRLPTEVLGRDIAMRTVPSSPQYKVFTDGNGAYSYSFGNNNSLFANIELTSLNEKLGSYFGTTEGVLVVNIGPTRDLLFTMKSPGSAGAGGGFSGGVARGGGGGGGVAAGRMLDTTYIVSRGGRGGAGAAPARVDTVNVTARTSSGAAAGGRGMRVESSPVNVEGVPLQRRTPFTMGLEPGDVIVSVDGRKVTSPSQLMRIVATYEHNDEFKLQIMRQKRAETLTVKIP